MAMKHHTTTTPQRNGRAVSTDTDYRNAISGGFFSATDGGGFSAAHSTAYAAGQALRAAASTSADDDDGSDDDDEDEDEEGDGEAQAAAAALAEAEARLQVAWERGEYHNWKSNRYYAAHREAQVAVKAARRRLRDARQRMADDASDANSDDDDPGGDIRALAWLLLALLLACATCAAFTLYAITAQLGR